MYTLLHSMPFRQLLSQQLPFLGSSLLIAEVFYKFHSFLLETGAFLATWFAAPSWPSPLSAKETSYPGMASAVS